MTLAASRVRFSELLAKLVLKAREAGFNIAFDEVRVFETRVGLDSQGAKQPFTDRIHAKGSFHYKGLAADLILWDRNWEYLNKTEAYTALGELWTAMDPQCTWGGAFRRPDGNHFSFGEGR